MLQRNTSGAALLLPTLTPPVTVQPGDDIDHEEPLAGFTPVAEFKDQAPPDGDTKPATKAETSTSRGDKE